MSWRSPIRSRHQGGFEIRTLASESPHGGVCLGSGKRAHRVDESSARPDQVGHAEKHRDLQAGQPGQRLLRRPPQQLRAPPGRSEARARRIQEDRVERSPEGGSPGVLNEDMDSDPEPLRCPADQPGSGQSNV